MTFASRPRPLAHFVSLLLFAMFLPTLVLGAVVVSRVGLLDRGRANQQALQVALSVSADIDREIDGGIETLVALATSVALRQGDLSQFYEQAAQTMRYRQLHVLLRALDGQQILNTRVPYGAPIPKQDLTGADREVITTRRPVASSLVMGALTQNWVVALSVPVIQDNEVRYILSMSLEPKHFQNALTHSVPADGWVIAVSDQTGRLIARSVEHDAYVGREMHPDVRAWSSGTQGVHRMPSLAGDEVVRGYAWSSKTGWLAAAFIPSVLVDGPLNALWHMLTLMTVGLLAVAVPLMIFVSKQLTGPIVAAVEAARALGRGEDVATVPSRMLEANALSAALKRASVELGERTKALTETETRHRSVFEQSAVGFEQVALDGTLLGVNDLLCKLLGYTRDECLAKTFKTLTHPDDWEAEDKLVNAVLKGEQPHYQFEKRLIRKSGEPIWVRVTSAAVRDPEGKVLYRTSVVEDVTERRKAREASARLAAIVQASPDAMFSTNVSGVIETWNPGGTKLFGYTSEEIVGQSLTVLASLVKPKEFDDNLAAISRGEVLKMDAKWRHKDGTIIDVAVSAGPIRTKTTISSISLTVDDIRDRKRREGHILLLNRELAHRVKNTLAVIQSISNQTMRSTPDPQAFRIAFQGRLQALSAANDLLMQTSWDGAELKDFIDKQLAPLLPRGSAQLRKDGPSVVVPAELTVHLGLALHELGTNALKYGAWSTPTGHVHLQWSIHHGADDETHRLKLTWTEKGGPTVKSPDRYGFGASLIEKGIPDSRVERHFLPHGLVCTINVALPLSRPFILG
jgi:PAS domain S-box-containing protein